MRFTRRHSLRLLAVLLTFTEGFSLARAQDSVLTDRLVPEGLGIANQLHYSLDWKTKLEILEDWLNLDYQYKILSAGIRYEVFQPNDPNASISRGKDRYADIAFKYVSVDVGKAQEGAALTIGNFYCLFGRGLILKSYEDRDIRVDNNLLGIKITGRYGGLRLTALTGQPADFTGQRADVLHAVDVEYSGWKYLSAGGTFASHQPDAAGAARTRLASVRIQPRIWNFEGYAEYGIKQNNDILEEALGESSGIVGRAIYGSAAWFLGSFSVVGEYKLYDNYGFRSSDQISLYNNPPALRRDYAYILLNRHPSVTDPDNERGFQVESNLTIGGETALNASYAVTGTLGSDSFYQRILRTSLPSRTVLRDLCGLATETWSDALKTTALVGYREELATNTRSLTPVLEAWYAITPTHSVRAIIEHQKVTDRTTAERYLDDVLTLEFLRAPDLSFSAVVEMQTHEPVAGLRVRSYWGFGQVGFKIGDHTDGSMLAGSRQAGYVCVGGVCRYEPEFRGIELRLISRF